jgi:hypothetical protein
MKRHQSIDQYHRYRSIDPSLIVRYGPGEPSAALHGDPQGEPLPAGWSPLPHLQEGQGLSQRGGHGHGLAGELP